MAGLGWLIVAVGAVVGTVPPTTVTVEVGGAPFLRPLRAARSARLLRLLTITGRIGVGFRAVSGRKGFRSFVLAVILVVFVCGLLV